MCGGCKLVGYFGKEEQKKDWDNHKVFCKAVTSLNKKRGVKHVTEKVNTQGTTLRMYVFAFICTQKYWHNKYERILYIRDKKKFIFTNGRKNSIWRGYPNLSGSQWSDH